MSNNTLPKIIAIIPARGGSKSIPGKNIKLLNHIPLIAYSIAAALHTPLIDRVIVSTDDPEIAKIAERWGAEVPFLRPEELAQDHTTDLPVFQHTIKWLEDHEGYKPDIIVQLRPTSPFRPTGSIENAIHVLTEGQFDSVRSITPSGQNPYKMWKIKDKEIAPILPSEFEEPYNMPRQKLPPTYWQTGHIEVIHRDTIIEKNSMTGSSVAPFIIESRYSIDLDTHEQWLLAEYAIRHWSLDIIYPKRQLRVV